MPLRKWHLATHLCEIGVVPLWCPWFDFFTATVLPHDAGTQPRRPSQQRGGPDDAEQPLQLRAVCDGLHHTRVLHRVGLLPTSPRGANNLTPFCLNAANMNKRLPVKWKVCVRLVHKGCATERGGARRNTTHPGKVTGPNYGALIIPLIEHGVMFAFRTLMEEFGPYEMASRSFAPRLPVGQRAWTPGQALRALGPPRNGDSKRAVPRRHPPLSK